MAKETDGQEKTEEPTGKKLDDARDEGKAPKSMEVNSLGIFFFGIVIIYLFRGLISSDISHLTIGILSSLDKLKLSTDLLQVYAVGAMLFYLKVLAPFFIVLVIVALAVGFGQVGIKLSPKALMPKFSKLNPLQGLKSKFFSTEPLVEAAKSLVKVIVVGLVSYWLLGDVILDSVNLVRFTIPEIVNYMSRNSISFLWKISAVYMILAASDFVYQKYKFKEDMKMTKQEVKEEMKNTEGDPQVKGRIKSKQMEMANRRMMADVPTADVVITNPTHFAVALKYEMGGEGAPTVVAKGADAVAQKIKDIAKEHDVPIHENVMLARALYKSCEVGDEIPPTLFKAVAEVLAYVFKLKNQKKKKTIV
jgi:flagellar biosynthetic protein FlhB